MPKDNIERAIARGAGAGEGGEAYDAVTYEGYGAGGAALIVEALTDNRNRTAADVRLAFSKFGGSLGTPGSVAWMFERKGVIDLGRGASTRTTITLAAADGGRGGRARGRRRLAGHVRAGTTSRRCATRSRPRASRSRTPASSLLPKTTVEVDADQARTLLRLVDVLEESDDVQDVYFNFDIPTRCSPNRPERRRVLGCSTARQREPAPARRSVAIRHDWEIFEA